MAEKEINENEEKRSFFSILAPRVVKVSLTLKENKEEKKNKTVKAKKEIKISQENQAKAKENIEKELSNKIAMIKGQTILLEKNNEQTNSKINEISEDIKKLEEERDNQILEKFSNKMFVSNSSLKYILKTHQPIPFFRISLNP